MLTSVHTHRHRRHLPDQPSVLVHSVRLRRQQQPHLLEQPSEQTTHLLDLFRQLHQQTRYRRDGVPTHLRHPAKNTTTTKYGMSHRGPTQVHLVQQPHLLEQPSVLVRLERLQRLLLKR